MEDFGDFKLLKVKAHTVEADVLEGLIHPMRQAGNATADHFAVAARKIAAERSPTAVYEAHYARARSWHRHVLGHLAEWQTDILADAQAAAAMGEAGQLQNELPQGQSSAACGVRKHAVWICNGNVQCRACGGCFGHTATPEVIARKRCKGPLHARVLASLGIRQEVGEPSAFTVAEMRASGAEPWAGGEASTAQASATVVPEHGMHEVRRRLTFKQPPPSAHCRSEHGTVQKERDSGHLLVKQGRITFCDRCGRWAISRLSPGLMRKCAGTVVTSVGAYRIRRDRLRQGKHPLAGKKLV